MMSNQISVTPFSKKCIAGINEQIKGELTASYLYFAFSVYFSQQHIALSGVASFFKKQGEEEKRHADKLVEYLLLRGGAVELFDIKAPQVSSMTVLQAFEKAVALEKEVTKQLLALHQCALDEKEVHFAAFLEEQFLSEQIEEEDTFVRLVAKARLLGPGVGEYLLDKHLAD